jgi:multidrug resistance efflux pump
MGSDTYKKVHADLEARERQGIKTYGATLRSDTPVDLLTYAYEEALDQAVYLRAEIDRRDEALAQAEADLAELDAQIRALDMGDRPASPPAALLARAQAAMYHRNTLLRLVGR